MMIRMVCLANSFKTGGYCIAGKEVVSGGYGRWIRPVTGRLKGEVRAEECRYVSGEGPGLLDVIDVPLLKPDPRMHQTENFVIDAGRRWVKVDNYLLGHSARWRTTRRRFGLTATRLS